MSIISDALKKVSDKRRDTVRLKEEELANIFSTTSDKIESKKARWNMLSVAGTVFIVGLAIAAFFYLAQSVPMFGRTAASLPQSEDTETAPPGIVAGTVFTEKSVTEEASVKTLMPFKLNGITEGAGESFAIINNNILRKGEYFQGAQLIEIAGDNVTLLYDDKEVTLRIE
jgi:hypothetical protein